MKEQKGDDAKFTQAVLNGLPKRNMQQYFRERHNDDDSRAITNQVRTWADGGTASIFSDIMCTPDVFGKRLQQFQNRDVLGYDEAPLIFWLLAGYFRSKVDKIKETGIFRVTSSDAQLRDIEIHMSQENYPFLKSIDNPHLVANYWKRLLREMQEPLIPYDRYEDFGKLDQFEDNMEKNKEILRILSVMKQTQLIHYNTLKFLVKFFAEVVAHE